MTDQKGGKSTGLGAVLEELGFSEQEADAAENFFDGKAGEEVLAGFAFRDLSDMPS